MLGFRASGDPDDFDGAGLLQERHRSRYSLGSRRAFVPRHDDVVELHRRALDVGHDQERTPGTEEHGLDEERPALLAIGAGLLDHGEIIIARHPLKLCGAAIHHALQDEAVDMHPDFPGLGLIGGETGLRFLAAGGARLLEHGTRHFRDDIARHRRIDSDAGRAGAGVEGLGQRGRIGSDGFGLRAENDEDFLVRHALSSCGRPPAACGSSLSGLSCTSMLMLPKLCIDLSQRLPRAARSPRPQPEKPARTSAWATSVKLSRGIGWPILPSVMRSLKSSGLLSMAMPFSCATSLARVSLSASALAASMGTPDCSGL